MAKAGTRLQNPRLAQVTGMHKNTINKADRGEASNQTLAMLELVFRENDVKFDVDDDGFEWVGVKPKEE